jgi:hypothetical protein
MRHSIRLVLLTVILLLIAPAILSAQNTAPGEGVPTLLSAFFGLDDALPTRAIGLCLQAPGRDGMPVIFSQEINPYTLQAEDFAVTSASGMVSKPLCATLSPATDAGELRTVLLIGEFGVAESDEPVRVEVVGEIRNLDDSADFRGASVAVTPLASGPFMVIAESVPVEQWALDQDSGPQQGDGCPSVGTVQIVRTTWAGGVTVPGGEEAGETERAQYRVNVQSADGTTREVTPFALADIGDGDNNHLLCLDVVGLPTSVTFPGGYLYDPNADALNLAANLPVTVYASAPRPAIFDVRYCELVVTYRSGISLSTEIWNTLGLNDCPADVWSALDAQALQDELGALNVRLNGPRYWLMNEIVALGGVTASGHVENFGGLEMQQRAVLETRLRGDLVGEQFYSPTTVQRSTMYVFYAGTTIFTLTDDAGQLYVMQSYAQIIDPTLTLNDLATLGERLTLPEGWSYAAITLERDLSLIAVDETTIVQDDLFNTYQRAATPLWLITNQ